MSYEGRMRDECSMPSNEEIEHALLISLFNHNGTIKEFASGEEIVDEIADNFHLNEKQRTAVLERIYRKENRIVKSPLWHRLLYRAANSLSNKKLVSNPSTTFNLTKRKEWMLTENGFDEALKLLKIPNEQKEILAVRSYEVQQVVNKLIEAPRPANYYPIEEKRASTTVTKEFSIRKRGFRQAVIEAYDYKCSVCGLKINSPKRNIWEVEAAHIVPHSSKGKDDILNGVSFCHLHHWAFDVGWFSLLDDYRITVLPEAKNLKDEFGKLGNYDFIKSLTQSIQKILLPSHVNIYPHLNAIKWHRENIFNKK
jgi:hypothetical protein